MILSAAAAILPYALLSVGVGGLSFIAGLCVGFEHARERFSGKKNGPV